jgi:hypothetical protein
MISHCIRDDTHHNSIGLRVTRWIMVGAVRASAGGGASGGGCRFRSPLLELLLPAGQSE